MNENKYIRRMFYPEKQGTNIYNVKHKNGFVDGAL